MHWTHSSCKVLCLVRVHGRRAWLVRSLTEAMTPELGVVKNTCVEQHHTFIFEQLSCRRGRGGVITATLQADGNSCFVKPMKQLTAIPWILSFG